MHLVLWLCLRYSGALIRVIKDSGITLLAKIAGLLLAAIAVQLIADSVRGFRGRRLSVGGLLYG